MNLTRDHMRSHSQAPLVLACLVLSMIAGCSREDEEALRGRLEQWYALGPTVAFHATGNCAAGAVGLTDDAVKSAMPVTQGLPVMVIALARRGAAALDDPSQTPDAGMVALVNLDRATGSGMRRAALEGRACMNETVESAFRYALVNPRAVLAYDKRHAALMLLDPRTGMLIVAMGAADG